MKVDVERLDADTLANLAHLARERELRWRQAYTELAAKPALGWHRKNRQPAAPAQPQLPPTDRAVRVTARYMAAAGWAPDVIARAVLLALPPSADRAAARAAIAAGIRAGAKKAAA